VVRQFGGKKLTGEFFGHGFAFGIGLKMFEAGRIVVLWLRWELVWVLVREDLLVLHQCQEVLLFK
jgi:hypothetical protein